MDEYGAPPDNIGENKEHDERATYDIATGKYTVQRRKSNVQALINTFKGRGEMFFPTKPYETDSMVLCASEWPYGKSGSQSKQIIEDKFSDKVCSYESVMFLGEYWMMKMAHKSNSPKYAPADAIAGEYN